MRQRGLTDSHPRHCNPRFGFERMKTARAGLDRYRMRRRVAASLTLASPPERSDGSPAAAQIRKPRADRDAKNTSKRITSVDNVMTHA
jgi:hypothetical protein